MTSESSKLLHAEIFSTVLAELGASFAGIATVEKLIEGNLTCIKVKPLPPGTLPMKSFQLGRHDMEAYSTANIFLHYSSDDSLCPYSEVFIFVALDINDLCKVVQYLQQYARNWIVYFNGCDRTSVRQELALVNPHERVFKAIWLSAESRPALREMALYHSLKTQAMQISTQENKIAELLLERSLSIYVKNQIRLADADPGSLELAWMVANNGTYKWPEGCRAEIAEGEATAEFAEIPPLAPNQPGTIIASLHSSGGEIKASWAIVTPSGKRFGLLRVKGTIRYH